MYTYTSHWWLGNCVKKFGRSLRQPFVALFDSTFTQMGRFSGVDHKEIDITLDATIIARHVVVKSVDNFWLTDLYRPHPAHGVSYF